MAIREQIGRIVEVGYQCPKCQRHSVTITETREEWGPERYARCTACDWTQEAGVQYCDNCGEWCEHADLQTVGKHQIGPCCLGNGEFRQCADCHTVVEADEVGDYCRCGGDYTGVLV